MKKIMFFVTTFLLLIITSIPIMAYDEVNVNIKDVQTTEIDFVYNQRDISSEALDNIPKSIEVVKEKNKIYLRQTVSNVDLEKTLKTAIDNMEKFCSEYIPEDARKLKNADLVINAAFSGYPFGGRTGVNISAGKISSDINVKMNGTFSVNNGDYVSEQRLTSADFPLYIEFGTNTIDSLEISIEPQSNYKTVYVKYTIDGSKEVYSDMSKDRLEAEGFTVLNQSKNNLVLEYTYNDIEAFNSLFNLDLVKIFNIIGTFNISASKSIVNNLEVTGKLSNSEVIKNVLIKVVMPKSATDSTSGYEGTVFTYDGTSPATIDIVSKNANTSTILIITIVPLCIAFVIAALLMLNKRGKHIRY